MYLTMGDVGLILEGGGMRGVYTCGVLDVLAEAGIFFGSCYGVSAGVCHACSYLSRQLGRAFRTVIDYSRDHRYGSFRSLLTTGDYFGVRMAYQEIPDKLLPFDYGRFAEKKESLWAVLTDCRTGRAEYRPVEDLRRDMDLIRASSSLPLLSRMVSIGGRPYLDGGIADSIPLARSVADGNRRNVVVLTRHKGYQKDPSRGMLLMEARYRGWPSLTEAIRTRHQRYNEALALVDREEAAGRALVIRPTARVEIGRLERNPDKLRALYGQGRGDMEAQLPRLMAFLGL